MKIIFATLLLVVCLTSIESSSQGSNNGGAGHHFRYTPYLEMGNLQPGHIVLLPNGNIFVASRRGDAYFEYHMEQNTVTVQQRGLATITIPPGPYSQESYRSRPGVTVFRVDDHRPPRN